jgi:hypothetical protein
MRRLTCLAVLLLAAVPLFATEPNPSQKQRELLDKLLTQINMDRLIKSMMDSVFGEIEARFVAESTEEGDNPEYAVEGQEMFKSFRAKASRVDFDGLLREQFIHIYAKYFNEQEIIDLTNFYASPTGRKTLDVMDDLMRDGMRMGIDHLQPKIEEIMNEVKAEAEKKRPWRRTMADMRSIAVAVEAYATDNDEFPEGDYTSLKAALEPTYIRELPEKDMWDHQYAYVVSDDKKSYRIVSAGADSIFEWDSRRIVPLKEGETQETRYRDRLEEDLIFEDGQFVQLPVQAKPKTP